jgi:ferritin-like metal-binding protein YciE
MDSSQQKIVQYLNEAHASERALTRVLQSQIAMTPRGSYRKALEQHLRETRDHAERLQTRLGRLRQGRNPIQLGVGIAESVAGQALALAKTPLDLVRGTSGEEKVLKNAKDTCATEALEIATYTSIERLARAVGDDETAKLASSIRADEQRMLERVLDEIPALTAAMVGADIKGEGSYDITKTGAADAARKTGRQARRTAKSGAKQATASAKSGAKRTARQARRAPGATRVEGEARGAAASAQDLPIARYDALNADEVVSRLGELSQLDLVVVQSYERRNQGRTTVLDRIDSLRGDEPWNGYDQQTADDVVSALTDADGDRRAAVRSYERSHKGRKTVLEAAERETANA